MLLAICRKLALGLLLSTLILAVSGCGFKLRGYHDQAKAIGFAVQQLQLTADPESAFTAVLLEQIKAYGVQVKDNANIQLSILQLKLEKRTLSYNNRTKGVEFQLIRKLRFQVADMGTHQTLIKPTDMQAERTYLYDNTKIAAMQQQEQAVLAAVDFDLANNLLTLINNQLSR